MGASLWEIPELYIENSPIFKIDQVTTPILIMHNKKDDLVPWMQSVEFFTGLRRLGKKAWMLQYDQGGHGVGGQDAIDFAIRLTQFFRSLSQRYSTTKMDDARNSCEIKGHRISI